MYGTGMFAHSSSDIGLDMSEDAKQQRCAKPTTSNASGALLVAVIDWLARPRLVPPCDSGAHRCVTML